MACMHVESVTKDGGGVYTITYVYTVTSDYEAKATAAIAALRRAAAAVDELAAEVAEVKECCQEQIEKTWDETWDIRPSLWPNRVSRRRPERRPGSFG